MKINPFLPLLLLLCVISPALAQTPAQTPKPAGDEKDDVVRITTNLVQVDAVVTKDGKLVTNLTADDFEIFEDGKRQAITNFAYISNLPSSASPAAPAETKKTTTPVVPYAPVKPNEGRRTIAFVVDDLGLSAESLGQVKKQLRKFLAEQLSPNDLVAIIHTGGEMGALQQFTNDRRVLTRAVDQLRWNYCSSAGIHVLPSVRSFRNELPICSWDSYLKSLKAVRFIVDALGYLPGRKSMVLLSDNLPIETQEESLLPQDRSQRPEIGNDNDVSTSQDPSLNTDSRNYYAILRKIAEKAIRSSVVIYAVDTQGLQYTGPTAADDISARDPRVVGSLISARSKLLYNRRQGGELIAKQTGGFQVRNSNDYNLDKIMEDQAGYYLIGYRPTDETFNRSFHHIKARVKRSGMNLRTRFGFFGVTEEEAARTKPLSTQDVTNLALASPFVAQDIEVDMTSFFVEDTAGGSIVRSFVYIDAKNLTFTPANGKYQSSIELHGAIFGDNGAIAQQMKRGATISLSERDYQQAMANGMGLSFDMPVKRAGAYQARLVVRDRPSSRIGSAGQFVVVPDLKNKKPAVSGIILGLPNADQSVSNAGGRRFRQNDNLYFGFNIYNATNETGQLRNLAMNAMLFRDGKAVYSGPEVPISGSNQKDLSRVFTSSVIKLTPDLVPGNYYLQVVITDQDNKNKAAAPVVQWIDFEIEK
ncbi:MAG TPA: VWA domain-containing protein [Pyrinomonadaceae bacterium]|jgi:VWFA-related protein|nr:VWA domain-containing protein [Pyrinomonadaceae bacterium]